MTDRYRKPVTIYLPPGAREQLESRASSEARTVSKMGELLLVNALGVSAEGGVVGERTDARGPSPKGRPAAKTAAVRSSAPPKRKTACEHRLPPDAFCARCDVA